MPDGSTAAAWGESDWKRLVVVVGAYRIAELAAAARALESVPPRERRDALEEVIDAFDRLYRSWYGGGRMPRFAMVRAALAACGGGAARLAPLIWGRRNFVHQFLSQEYVDALAGYVIGTRLEPVVEVGAGRGELARALRQQGIAVYASDDGSWLDGRLHWPSLLPHDVSRLGYAEALRLERPALVLCSWMPRGEDWTPAFRACATVKEYLLLGEAQGGATGTPESFDAPLPWRGERLDAISRWSVTRNVDSGHPACVYSVRQGGRHGTG